MEELISVPAISAMATYRLALIPICLIILLIYRYLESTLLYRAQLSAPNSRLLAMLLSISLAILSFYYYSSR